MKRLKKLQDSHHLDEADSEGQWAISYGDMVTLLLCFFILFFTVNPSRDEKETVQQELLNIMMREMSNSATRSPAQAGGPSDGGSSKHRSSSPEEKKEVEKTEADSDGTFDAKDAAKWDGKIHKVGSRIVVEFPGISFFKSGKIEVTRDGIENLRRFTNLYLPYISKNQLAIQAFTDLKRVRSGASRKFSDNLELSALRSVAAMRVLQHAGIPLARMRVGGYGEMKVTSRELASLHQDESKAYDLARRVVLVIQPEGRIEP